MPLPSSALISLQSSFFSSSAHLCNINFGQRTDNFGTGSFNLRKWKFKLRKSKLYFRFSNNHFEKSSCYFGDNRFRKRKL